MSYEQIPLLDLMISASVPSVFGRGFSYYECLNAVIEKVNTLVTQCNSYFSVDLSAYVTTVLQGWQNDGTLANLISGALQTEIDNVRAQVNTQFINVKYPPAPYTAATGDNNIADKAIIQAMLSGLDEGATLYFPDGTYLTDGLVMSKGINIIGQSVKNTIIKNTSANPALNITLASPDIYRKVLKNFTLKGNGTLVHGLDATSGHGLVIDNSPYWTIENVRIVNHGGYGIFLDSMAWSDHFINCLIGYNKLDNVRFIASSSDQKNDISFDKCSITGGGASGFNFWGVKINIENCSIDDHLDHGICINADNVNSAYACYAVSILKNYFENSAKHHLYIKGAYTTYSRVIRGLTIQDNYMYQNVAESDGGIADSVLFASDPVDTSSPTISNMSFINNLITTSDLATVKCADFGGVLGDDCIIKTQNATITAGYYHGFGLARLTVIKSISLNGFTAYGVTWASEVESPNISTGTTIIFPVPVALYAAFIKMGVYVNTDATNYSVNLTLKHRDRKTNAAYSTLWSFTKAALSGAQLVETLHQAAYGDKRTLLGDLILTVTITITTAGTGFKIANPYLEYVD